MSIEDIIPVPVLSLNSELKKLGGGPSGRIPEKSMSDGAVVS